VISFSGHFPVLFLPFFSLSLLQKNSPTSLGHPRVAGARARRFWPALASRDYKAERLDLYPIPSSIMSSFWADACNFAKNRGLHTQLLVLNGFCGSVVSRARRVAQAFPNPKELINHS
jgi:hypothetical protein